MSGLFSIKPHSIKNISIVLPLLFVFIYVCVKASATSFTHDESLSYLLITGKESNYADTANHHLLNTWLMKICYHLFGNSEFSLRLPNILAFILFSIGVFNIVKNSNKPLLISIGIVAITYNPYLIDFFCLARGYGLALGFSILGISYLLQDQLHLSWNKYLRRTFIILSLIYLSVLSNLVFLNLNLAIIIVLVIDYYYVSRQLKSTRKSLLTFICISITNLVLLYPLLQRLFFLKYKGELYFGGQDGFIDNTLIILIHRSIYVSYYGELFWQILLKLIIIVFLLGTLSLFKYRTFTPLKKITLILLLLISASVIQFHIFDALFPMERTSLMFIPLFGIFLFFLFKSTMNQKYITFLKKPSYFLSGLLSVVIVLHFVLNMQIQAPLEFRYDNLTKSVVTQIEQTSDAKNITLTYEWIFDPAIQYYFDRFNISNISTNGRNGILFTSDFIYCTNNMVDSVYNTGNYEIILESNYSNTYLLKKTQ